MRVRVLQDERQLVAHPFGGHVREPGDRPPGEADRVRIGGEAGEPEEEARQAEHPQRIAREALGRRRLEQAALQVAHPAERIGQRARARRPGRRS